MFIDVRLETTDGRYVITAIIPAFKMMPDVLYWGDRTFKPHELGPKPIYRECFAVAVVQTKEET